jgi:hypothetical protein
MQFLAVEQVALQREHPNKQRIQEPILMAIAR